VFYEFVEDGEERYVSLTSKKKKRAPERERERKKERQRDNRTI
jgi:hypothetical protein